MRSEMVFAAENRLPNRYMLCRVLAKATRKVHKPATRIEDTTDAMLRGIANANAAALWMDSVTIVQNSKKLSVKRVFSRRSCRSSNIAVVGEAQDRCYFRVNSTQLVLIHAFAFGQVTAFIQARSHYTAKFEALSSSRNEPRSSNQSTHCSEVTLRRCPAGASRYMN